MTINPSKKINKIKYLSILFFLFVFFYPNNGSFYFDGLPFTNKYETLLFCIFFPITWFFSSYFKSLKIFILLTIIIILKIILIYSPINGVNVKQFFTYENKLSNKYIKTFDSFWNKEISYLQKYSWKSQKNFPLDWTHLSKVNSKSENLNNRDDLYIAKYDDFKTLEMYYEFNFYLPINEKTEIYFETGNSSTIIEQSFKVFNKENNSYKEYDVQLLNNNQKIILKNGLYNIDLIVKYSGTDWKFIPYTIVNSDKISLFKKKDIYTNLEINRLVWLPIQKKIGNIYDYLIFIFLILVVLEIYLYQLKKEKNCIYYCLLFFLSYLVLDKIINYIFDTYAIIDGVGSFTFGFTNILVLSLIIFKKFYKQNSKDEKSFFILTSIITCMYVFANIFSFDLESHGWAGIGDDWTTFQEYSRQIVIENEWLKAGEEVFYFRPGSRYIYAISHIIFGMSGFAYKMLNIWCICLSSFLVIKILKKMNCSIFLSYLAGTLLLGIYTADNFRWILMVGLSEYYAMICLMISLYLIINEEKLSNTKFILIVLLGITEIWLREEHAPVVISLIFLLKYKDETNNSSFFPYFKYLINYINNKKGIIIFYSSLIIMGFLSIFIRNYFVGGRIGILDINAVRTLTGNKDIAETITTLYYHVFSRLILGVDQYVPTMPKIYSIFNILAIIISLCVIFNYKKFNYFHFGLPIVLLSIIFPYFFVENIAYTPRYVIHFLPMSIIICFVFLNKYFKKSDAKSINNRIKFWLKSLSKSNK